MSPRLPKRFVPSPLCLRLRCLCCFILLFFSSSSLESSSNDGGDVHNNNNNDVSSWPRGTQQIPSHGRRHQHRRWRRAPAVWGEPAPDYSMAALDPRTHIYLYALLFVDLKTSDHYRREHAVIRREVMRLAKEANNYFFQINLRLVVVDVLQTFRDDLSLYSFEQYRNQRMAQLPFHNFAVLVTYRYAGGLAFVGGMCSAKSVMLAGFYPHNPEAMGSIFFHEVAHLFGVPHRPANETLEVPNCACSAYRQRTTLQGSQLPATQQSGDPVSGLLMDDAQQQQRVPGCLKIPGFDQDCSLQLMVNLALRTRCLAREPRADLQSLPLCGNGLREEGEQCDCGLATKCAEWNCHAQQCARRWPLWAMWTAGFGACLALFGPALACFWLRRWLLTCRGPSTKRRRRLLFVRLPLEGTATGKCSKVAAFQHRRPAAAHNGQNGQKIGQSVRRLFASALKPFRALWRRRSTAGWKDIDDLKPTLSLPSMAYGHQIRRPVRPPPPPPAGILAKSMGELRSPSSTLSSRPSSTLSRPRKPPPPRPPSSHSSASKPPLLIRPKAMPPAPPQRWPPEEEQEAEEDEDEWDDYCE